MVEQPSAGVDGAASLLDVERAMLERSALMSLRFREAVLEDFIDDLVRPVRPAALALRLHLSQTVMDNHIATGALAAVLTESGWAVDTVAGHDWIDHFLLSVSRRLLAFPEVHHGADRARSLLALVELRAAVIQDFLDDLPRFIEPAELALRLQIKRAVVYDHIARGLVSAKRTNRRWAIDVDANRLWIAERIAFVSGPPAGRWSPTR